jgi:glycosyltransferase involved in cell wall biosynthesis
MKIVLIHYSAPPTIGGVEQVIAQHARLMASAGHEVTILAGTGDVFDRRIRLHKASLIDSRNTSILDMKKKLDQGLVPADFGYLIKEISKKIEPVLKAADLVIAHNVCSLHKNLPLTAALHEFSQKPDMFRLILWHHDLAWTSERYKGELHKGYPWDLLRTAWPGVRNVTISNQRGEQIAQLFGIPDGQIDVIPNGIDITGFLKLGSIVRALISDMPFTQAGPILLLPVRVTRRKNIELAIKSMEHVRKEFPHALLLITGPLGAHNPTNSKYLDELKSLTTDLALEGSVRFLEEEHGFLSDEVIADLYRIADGLFLPSREEGFGIPVLEAGLVGIPTFCSDIAALREVGGEGPYYFPPDEDPRQVGNVISSVYKNSKSFQQRQRIRLNYSWHAIYRNQIAPLLESNYVPRT